MPHNSPRATADHYIRHLRQLPSLPRFSIYLFGPQARFRRWLRKAKKAKQKKQHFDDALWQQGLEVLGDVLLPNAYIGDRHTIRMVQHRLIHDEEEADAWTPYYPEGAVIEVTTRNFHTKVDRTVEEVLGLLLHEMCHAVLWSRSCACEDCKDLLLYKGGHGEEWEDLAGECNGRVCVYSAFRRVSSGDSVEWKK